MESKARMGTGGRGAALTLLAAVVGVLGMAAWAAGTEKSSSSTILENCKELNNFDSVVSCFQAWDSSKFKGYTFGQGTVERPFNPLYGIYDSATSTFVDSFGFAQHNHWDPWLVPVDSLGDTPAKRKAVAKTFLAFKFKKYVQEWADSGYIDSTYKSSSKKDVYDDSLKIKIVDWFGRGDSVYVDGDSVAVKKYTSGCPPSDSIHKHGLTGIDARCGKSVGEGTDSVDSYADIVTGKGDGDSSENQGKYYFKIGGKFTSGEYAGNFFAFDSNSVFIATTPDSTHLITFNPGKGGQLKATHYSQVTKTDSTLADSVLNKAQCLVSRTNRRFGGWYNIIDSVGGVKITSSSKFPTDSTLYAHWDSTTYSIVTDSVKIDGKTYDGKDSINSTLVRGNLIVQKFVNGSTTAACSLATDKYSVTYQYNKAGVQADSVKVRVTIHGFDKDSGDAWKSGITPESDSIGVARIFIKDSVKGISPKEIHIVDSASNSMAATKVYNRSLADSVRLTGIHIPDSVVITIGGNKDSVKLNPSGVFVKFRFNTKGDSLGKVADDYKYKLPDTGKYAVAQIILHGKDSVNYKAVLTERTNGKITPKELVLAANPPNDSVTATKVYSGALNNPMAVLKWSSIKTPIDTVASVGVINGDSVKLDSASTSAWQVGHLKWRTGGTGDSLGKAASDYTFDTAGVTNLLKGKDSVNYTVSIKNGKGVIEKVTLVDSNKATYLEIDTTSHHVKLRSPYTGLGGSGDSVRTWWSVSDSIASADSVSTYPTIGGKYYTWFRTLGGVNYNKVDSLQVGDSIAVPNPALILRPKNDTLWTLIEGYTAQAATAKNITIKNPGEGVFNKLTAKMVGDSASCFTLSYMPNSSDSTKLITLQKNDSVTVSITPVTGKLEGERRAMLLVKQVNGNDSIQDSVWFRLKVGKGELVTVTPRDSLAVLTAGSSDSVKFDVRLDWWATNPAPAAVADVSSRITVEAGKTKPAGVAWSLSAVTKDSGDSVAFFAGNAVLSVVAANAAAVAKLDSVKLSFGSGANLVNSQPFGLQIVLPPPTITATPSSITFDAAVEGYRTQPAAQTVTIKNTSAVGSVRLIQPALDSVYDITALTPATAATTGLAVNGTATFTVRPKLGLTEGHHDEMIRVIGYNIIDADGRQDTVRAVVAVSFDVAKDSTYAISATPSPLSFGRLTSGYAQPAAQTVTVKNVGTGTVKLAALPATTGTYALSAWSPATAATAGIAAGGTATFTVRPNAGLAVGNYDEVIRIDGNDSAGASVKVLFEVVSTPSYTLKLTPGELSFGSKEVGYVAAPDTQFVTIENTGTAALTLTKTTAADYFGGNFSAASVAPGAKATFGVRPKVGLPVGAHKDRITVTGTSGANKAVGDVELSFNVVGKDSVTTEISVSARELSFGTAQKPYAQPAAKVVTVTNIGTEAVTLSEPAATEGYDVGALSQTGLGVGEKATFTVRPRAGLDAKVYDNAIAVTTADGKASDTVAVKFTVTDPPVYSITASPLSVLFVSMVKGYAQPPAAQTVTIRNTGTTGAVTLDPLPSSANFDIKGLTPAAGVITAGGSATFTVQPKPDLPPGSYNEDVTITGSNGASAATVLSFTVEDAPTYTISASPTPLAFGALLGPAYTQPQAKSVTVTNTGTGTITGLTASTASKPGNYTISSLSSSLAAGASATFTVRPNANLGFGVWDDTIKIDGSNGVGASVFATFEVALAPKYGISAADSVLSFGSMAEGYKTPPAAKTVTITNTGTSPVTLAKPTSDLYNLTNYDIGALSSTTVAVGGTATFTVRPKIGLEAAARGNYDEEITIDGTSNGNAVTAVVKVSFNVVESGEETYEITASRLTSFGTVQEPYTPPAAQTVTVTNIGTGTVTLEKPTSTKYVVGPPSPPTVEPGKTATFVVRPDTGLGVGNHDEEITIKAGQGGAVVATAAVTASFAVTKAPTYTISATPSSVSFVTTVQGYTQPPAAQTVTIKNTSASGSLTLTPFASLTSPNNYYVLTQLTPAAPIAAGASATFTVRPQTGLPAGNYEEKIKVTGGSGVEAEVALSFVVMKEAVSAITATALTPFGSVLGPTYLQPAAQTVTVYNVGTASVTLTKPASVNYDIGNLTKTSVPAGDSAKFTVAPKANLNYGTYNDTLVISGGGGTSAEVVASFAVVLNQVNGIGASPRTVSFGDASPPYQRIAARTVTVTNIGTNKIDSLKMSTKPVDYEVDDLPVTSLVSGASLTFTVRPNDALTIPGTYNGFVTISGKSGGADVSVTVDFEFNVTNAATYKISRSPAELSFGSLQAPYTQPAAKTVTITNTGTGTVTLKQPTAEPTKASAYTIGSLTPTNVIAAGKTATFTVRPNAGLVVGDYGNAVITIENEAGASLVSPVTVTASFKVVPAPGISIITQPKSVSVSLGSITGSLTVDATVDPSDADLTFKWYKPTTATTTGGTLVGTTTVVSLQEDAVVSNSFPIPANLAAGTHYYYVVVSTPGAADVKSDLAMVTVSSIKVTPLETFVSVYAPYVQPSAQTVTITNAGTATVTLEQPKSSETNSGFIVGTLSATSLAGGRTATFTVRPKAGLTPGAYDEVITIRGNNGAIATVVAAFTVYSVSTPVITLSPLTSFGAQPTPYKQPAVQTVIVTNTGTEPVKLDITRPGSFEVGVFMRTVDGMPMDADELLVNGAKVTFTVRPNPDLDEGPYSEDITVTATGESGNDVKKVRAIFEVEAPLTYSMSASPLTTFGHVYSTPYTVPAQQWVTITNTGTGPITNLSLSAAGNYEVGVLSTRTLAAKGAKAEFTIRPLAGLPVGNHDEEITVSGLGGVSGDSVVSALVLPTFAVAPVRTIAASIPDEPYGDFGDPWEPYEQPDAQVVVVTSTCDSVVTLVQPASADYIIGKLSKITLRSNGDTASFTVQPRADLEVGRYDEKIIVACGPGGASVTVPVTFTVNGEPTYKTEASQTLLSFGTLKSPYTRPAAQSLTITNKGSGEVVLELPAESENYDYWFGSGADKRLSAILEAKGSKATLTVQPKAGLPIGNHDEEILVEGSYGSGVAVAASFNVTSASVFAVTFDAMGGSVSPASATTGENGKLEYLPVPTRDGYTFGGWFRSAAGGAAVTTSTVFGADATIYARWGGYAVTFRAGANGTLTALRGGSPIELGSDDVSAGETVVFYVSAGETVVFIATPIDGYRVVRWTVNGVVQADTARSYTLFGLSKDIDVVVSFDKDVSTASPDRVVPARQDAGVSLVSPVPSFSAGLTAGPNPVVRSLGGSVSLYRYGTRVAYATLTVYDAAGNVVKRIRVIDDAVGSQLKRKVSTWNLRDASGRKVSPGAYLIKGVVKTSGGNREAVSVVVGVL